LTISLALSAGTLMASAGTPYRLVPAHFYPWLTLHYWEIAYQKLCIFLTGGAYAPYASCMATPLRQRTSLGHGVTGHQHVGLPLCRSTTDGLCVTQVEAELPSQPAFIDTKCRRRGPHQPHRRPYIPPHGHLPQSSSCSISSDFL